LQLGDPGLAERPKRIPDESDVPAAKPKPAAKAAAKPKAPVSDDSSSAHAFRRPLVWLVKDIGSGV